MLHICALVDPSRKSTGWFVVPAPGKYSGLALPIGPVPGAMPNMTSREAAAPPSAAPPRSFFRSTFARCAGEEQEQQAADAADASSIGPQPSYMHGTRRPLAAGQLGHLRNLLMHPARPPTPFRRPSHALSRTCRPLSFASRAPHTLPSYMCPLCQQVSRSEGLVGSGGWAQGGQISRLMLGWGVVAERVQDGRKRRCCCFCLLLSDTRA